MVRSSCNYARGNGQVLILFALFGFVLVGALALAFDVGYLLSERRDAQAAADAAALAGARALLAGESNSMVKSTAQSYATTNGLPPSPNSSFSVSVQGGQLDGSVTVDLTIPVQRYFLGAVYTGTWEVSARAIADVSERADARYIMIALEPPGIYVNGSMRLRAKDGSIMSNDIVRSSGESNIVITDGFIDAVGTIDTASGWQAPWGIREGRAPANDPFAEYEPPDKPGGPAITDKFRCKKNDYGDPEEFGDDCRFWPGYYKNTSIRIWDRTKFEPGLYFLDNSSIEMISNSGAEIDARGVNFYFTGNPSKSYFKPGIGSAMITAPGWSPNPDDVIFHHDYRDIVIWYDMCPGPNLESSGNQEFFLGGVTYAPCSNVTLYGNPAGDTVSGMLVAGTITVKGSSDTGVAYLPYARTSSYEVYLSE